MRDRQIDTQRERESGRERERGWIQTDREGGGETGWRRTDRDIERWGKRERLGLKGEKEKLRSDGVRKVISERLRFFLFFLSSVPFFF